MGEGEEMRMYEMCEDAQELGEEQLKRKQLRKTRRIRRRFLLHIWALKNYPRTSFKVPKIVPADWGIEDQHQGQPQMVEKLRQFNELTNQHWQFSPTTGKLEIVHEQT